MAGNQLVLLTTERYRVAFPAEPRESRTVRGGTKYDANADGCSVRFVEEHFGDEALALNELSHDYEIQFTDDGYEEFGEKALQIDGRRGRLIEAKLDTMVTRILEVVDGKSFYRLLIENEADDPLGRAILNGFELHAAKPQQEERKPGSKTAETRNMHDALRGRMEALSAKVNQYEVEEEADVENLSWLEQLARTYRGGIVYKVQALLVARWEYRRLTPKILERVAENGRSEPSSEVDRMNALRYAGASPEDALRLSRQNPVWASLAFYLTKIAAARGESLATPDVQQLAFRILAGQASLSEVLHAYPADYPPFQPLRASLMSGEWQQLIGEFGPTFENTNILVFAGFDAAMAVARADIPRLVGIPELGAQETHATAAPATVLQADAVKTPSSEQQGKLDPELQAVVEQVLRTGPAAALFQSIPIRASIYDILSRTATKTPDFDPDRAIAFFEENKSLIGEGTLGPREIVEKAFLGTALPEEEWQRVVSTGSSLAAQVGLTRAAAGRIIDHLERRLDEGYVRVPELGLRALAVMIPENARVHLLLGRILVKQQLFDQAMSEYSRSLELDASTEALAYRGELYLQLGKFEEGLADLRGAMKLDPNRDDPHAIRARALSDMTIKALREAIAKKRATETE